MKNIGNQQKLAEMQSRQIDSVKKKLLSQS